METLEIPKLPFSLYNTESRHKEVLHPLKPRHVTMYTCGPTVYHFAHIGNFRTYVFEDILRRTLKFFGYEVTQVMNITDIDDKTLRGAREQEVSLSEYTHPYKNAFFVDLQALGIERAEHYPCATDYVPYMIDFIQKLLDKGAAYMSKDGSVYYSIERCPRYGRLSHLKLDELKVGTGDLRVSLDEYDKENVGDFVLWKGYDSGRDGAIYWESPFGKGRPGWHLECSTMAMTILGDTIDIHVGAVDNIFPHHENEIAQSEAHSGKLFVKHWLHSEHLIVEGKKMSKSLGNFYTLRDLLAKGYTGIEVRYLLMHIHYRTQLNFTFEGMEGARHSLQRLNDFIARMQEMADRQPPPSPECLTLLQTAMHSFASAMADDLNISVALSAIFDMMHAINARYDQGKLSPGDAASVLSFMQACNRILNVFTFEREEEGPPLELQEMLTQRNQARADKNWAQADALRDAIHAAGYQIEDTPRGPRLKKS